MTGDRSQLINFVQKFLGTVKFGNDHVAKIMGYRDYQIGSVTISCVYYVEGLGHNLFSIGQFCDSDLEVAFRQHTCFIRNLEGVDLLTGSRGNNLYTLSLQDMMASSPICLLSKASKTKSWLWHRRLSHLNFGAINHLARQEAVATRTYQAVVTACFTQNRSIIRLRHGKTLYELMHGKQPDLSFFHVFGALCYPTNDSENVEHIGNDPLLGVPIPEVTSEQSSSTASPQSNVQPNHPMTHHNSKWTKDHPLNYIIGLLSRPVSTLLQLHKQALFCYYDAFLTSVEPKTYKEALTQACWIEAMQEELYEFERLEV
nr:integrase, catalytic region, zinc finger, CCHC-type, peptidase aspartic, catalytic [Tanacetum cinerariifolium]